VPHPDDFDDGLPEVFGVGVHATYTDM
jgi:hypothetical protein